MYSEVQNHPASASGLKMEPNIACKIEYPLSQDKLFWTKWNNLEQGTYWYHREDGCFNSLGFSRTFQMEVIACAWGWKGWPHYCFTFSWHEQCPSLIFVVIHILLQNNFEAGGGGGGWRGNSFGLQFQVTVRH